MKLEEKLTSLNLVNNRKYVHSSTIIDFIWKNIKQFVPSGFKQPIFMDIKFHQELKKMQNLFYLTNIRISQGLKIYRSNVEFIQKT